MTLETKTDHFSYRILPFPPHRSNEHLGEAASVTRYLLLLIALFLSIPGTSAGATASFTALGDLAGGLTMSLAYGVSDDGSTVVGESDSAAGREAFRWTAAAGMIGLGDLSGGAFDSYSLDVSVDGSVVVGASVSAAGNEAFRWTQISSMIGLGDLPGGGNPTVNPFYSHARAVSDDGSLVAGYSHSALGVEAMSWTSGTGMVGLGDLPGGIFDSIGYDVSADGLVVVGHGHSASGKEAMRWTSGTGMVGLGDLPGGIFESVALGVSSDGSIVLGHSNSASGGEAFLWTQSGGMVGLGDLPGGIFDSYAFDASDDGSIVVGRGHSALGQEAVVWDNSSGMQEVKQILVNGGINLTGWTLVEATGISADGRTLVGWGFNPSGNFEAWIATLPTCCDADVDGNGIVELADLNIVVSCLNVTPVPGHACEPADVNCDGVIDFIDTQAVLCNMATPGSPACCPAPTVTTPSPGAFCISGPGDGSDWSWQVDTNPPVTVPGPSPSTVVDLRDAYVSSINASSIAGLSCAAGPGPTCFTTTYSSAFQFWVGPPGGPANCLVSGNPAGCSFNPMIYEEAYFPLSLPGLTPGWLSAGAVAFTLGVAAIARNRRLRFGRD